MSQDVKELLTNAGVPYRVHHHAPRVSFSDQVDDPAVDPASAVKSLAFRLPDARYVIVGMRAQRRADHKLIADALGVRRADLRAASVEQLDTDLDMRPGGVTPLPVRGATVLLDLEVPALGTVFCGSGRNDVTIEISGRDLSRAAYAKICQITRSE